MPWEITASTLILAAHIVGKLVPTIEIHTATVIINDNRPELRVEGFAKDKDGEPDLDVPFEATYNIR